MSGGAPFEKKTGSHLSSGRLYCLGRQITSCLRLLTATGPHYEVDDLKEHPDAHIEHQLGVTQHLVYRHGEVINNLCDDAVHAHLKGISGGICYIN